MMELLDCGLVEDVLLDRGTPRDDVQAFVARVHRKVRVKGVSFCATFTTERSDGMHVWVLVDSCRERMLAVIGESSLEGEILEMTDATIH
jgi:hypothetical protein